MSKAIIHVNVFNYTNEDMLLVDEHLEHGIWLDRPESIENGHEGDFAAENGISCDIDVHVGWRTKRTRNDLSISIFKPFDGTTRFRVDSPDSIRYTISGDPQEHHAYVSVSFYRQEPLLSDDCSQH